MGSQPMSLFSALVTLYKLQMLQPEMFLLTAWDLA